MTMKIARINGASLIIRQNFSVRGRSPRSNFARAAD